MEDITIEKSSGNVFVDLGFDEPDVCLAKADLAMKIAQIINRRHLSQQQAAELLGITQPNVSAIFSGRLQGFSLEKLMLLLNALGRDVVITIKPKSRIREHGRLSVV